MPEQPFGNEMEELELRAHQYMYYCLGAPIIADCEYDRREREFLDGIGDVADSKLKDPGSDLPESYSVDEISLANALTEARGT